MTKTKWAPILLEFSSNSGRSGFRTHPVVPALLFLLITRIALFFLLIFGPLRPSVLKIMPQGVRCPLSPVLVRMQAAEKATAQIVHVLHTCVAIARFNVEGLGNGVKRGDEFPQGGLAPLR